MVITHAKLFKNRREAGEKLAKLLEKYGSENPVVLALPRGGVPVGFEVAKVLNAPLNVIITRKLGVPGNRELGVGSIGEGGVKILDKNMLSLTALSEQSLEEVIKEENLELKRRVKLYRHNRPLPNLKNKTVILVDDGLATGVTAKAAIASVKKLHPKKIIFASPICAYETARELSLLIDDVICFTVAAEIYAIGFWYENFEQTSDEEVLKLLKQAKHTSKKETTFQREVLGVY